ncbi:carbon starvation protein A [Flagellimonas sp.]|uniref:carbon starvation CstA family protein n=1 Tax=Flagellimonas sp. TaxID=2058762 RepID=UPI003B5C00A8
MISLIVSIGILLIGYKLYGTVVERVFGIDPDKSTPAVSKADGVDYVPMPQWKVFLIQFLNIAGLGPIFGAVAGALWGPISFLWIVLGSLFAGGVHDYFSGMLSLRHDGKSISEISGHYLGERVKQFMSFFTVFLLIMVGAVFLIGPAKILAESTKDTIGLEVWILIILFYYILSTVLPIDKIIGKIYPLFGIALILMSLTLLGYLFVEQLEVPELTWANLTNTHYDAEDFPIFPMLFITIACGAVSGFHATQSPLMARCISNERQGKRIFYGTMVTEGVVALIWAAISMSFFGGIKELNLEMANNNDNVTLIVHHICNALGGLGAILAILGVVAAPITSGDTSFRSARLIIADFLKSDQKPIKNRLLISVPLFVVGYLLVHLNFGVIWRYFAWANQTLATIVLWTITVYLVKKSKLYWISLVPALFMTMVVTTYIFFAPEGFSISYEYSFPTGAIITIVIFLLFERWRARLKKEKKIPAKI